MCCPGPDYEEMQTIIRRTVDMFVPRGIPEDRADDLYEAMLWYILNWPHLDNRTRNRDALGDVRHFWPCLRGASCYPTKCGNRLRQLYVSFFRQVLTAVMAT